MRRPREAGLASLLELLPAFSRAEVVVVGDFVADEYVYGETDRVSREAPVLIVRYESSELKAGCAGNAAQSHVVCHAAYIAWQLGRKLTFDPVKEEFPGEEQANRMRSRAMREPWRI